MGSLMADFDEVFRLLDKLEDPKDMAHKAIKKAERVLESKTRAAIASAGSASGDLSRSMIATGDKENSYGVYSVVRPVGADAKGNTFAKRAAWLEFGTSKAAPHPWRQKAINGAEAECIKAMEEVINAEIDKL